MKDTKLALAPVIAPGRAGTAERAIARCIEILSALVPQVDAEVAGAAIMRVASRTELRNMITGYLIAHPTALVDGDSGAPAPVARLIEDLIASGVEGLKPLAHFGLEIDDEAIGKHVNPYGRFELDMEARLPID